MNKFPENTPFEDVLEEYEIFYTVRTYNCLKRAGIKDIGTFVNMGMDELRTIRNLGRAGIEEILEARNELKEKQLCLCTVEESEKLKEACRKERTKEDLEALDKLIGLEEVKNQVKKLMALAKLQQFMKARGNKCEQITLNMEFVGNPGTAKTTVARIIARLFYDIGLVKGDKLFEVGKADLVGEYVGHTANKVKRLFDEAKGNVIFIDEAYSLVESERGSYGDEAISTIVKEMEDNREDTIVIFAGYPKEMAEFMARNTGLRSRVPFRIEFKDYSVEEMSQISEVVAGERGFYLDRKAKSKVKELCGLTSVVAGNGRFCRNLVENAVMSFAARNFGDIDDEPAEDMKFSLKAEDFEMPSSVNNTQDKPRQFGFCA